MVLHIVISVCINLAVKKGKFFKEEFPVIVYDYSLYGYYLSVCFLQKVQIETDSSTDTPPKKKPTRLAIGELHFKFPNFLTSSCGICCTSSD